MSSERNIDKTESSAVYRGESRLQALSEPYNQSLEEWWHRECHLSAENRDPVPTRNSATPALKRLRSER